MNVTLKKVSGPGYAGYVLDKHTAHSAYIGDDEYGHPRFNTVRTEVGEATFQLKYRSDWSQVVPLAQQLADSIVPLIKRIGLIVPMPASTPRVRQPVTEVARALGKIVDIPVFEGLLLKRPGASLKNLDSKEAKDAANLNRFYIKDEISSEGCWNVLVVDDLYHHGSSMAAAAAALATYPKIKEVYLAALTWRPH